jgi:putative sigma-54 modulation protein
MQIDFTGRQMEVTPELRHYTQEHSQKLSRFLPARCRLHLILAAQRHLRVAEATLKLRDRMLIGIGKTSDAHTSIKEALDKLERQVVRWSERQRARKRRPKPTTAVVLNILGSPRTDHQEHAILERERWPLEPLSVEKAVEALETTPRGLVVFRNTETDRVNVVYRRPDGKLALIEPEP